MNQTQRSSASRWPDRIALDREARRPLYTQIEESLRDLIQTGRLGSGVKLPSSRDLADDLGVHRTTVTAAYRQLTEDGWVESGVGQGTFVAEREAIADGSTADQRLSWSGLLPGATRTGGVTPPITDRTIVMDRAVPDPSLYPKEAVRDVLRSLIEDPKVDLLSYGPPEGDEILRQVLSDRLSRQGIDVEENQLLIVGGSQQGIDLVSRLLFRDGGGTVVVDAPTYRGALEVFRLNGAEIVALPIGESGTDLDALEELVARRRVRLIYGMPSFHNPTGLSLSESARRRLYEIARSARVPILEDDWLADLRGPNDPPPLKSMDDGGLVIHSGTFSKTAVPGFRVGWLLAPREVFPALVELKAHCDLSTGLVGQKVVARLIEAGHYDRHVTEIRAEYERRLAHGLGALERFMPESVQWTRPEGGMVHWLTLPSGVTGDDLARAAARRDLLVSPGELYLARRPAHAGLRLCYSLCGPEKIDEGIQRLAGALDEILEQNRRGQRARPAPLV